MKATVVNKLQSFQITPTMLPIHFTLNVHRAWHSRDLEFRSWPWSWLPWLWFYLVSLSRPRHIQVFQIKPRSFSLILLPIHYSETILPIRCLFWSTKCVVK